MKVVLQFNKFPLVFVKMNLKSTGRTFLGRPRRGWTAQFHQKGCAGRPELVRLFSYLLYGSSVQSVLN